MKKAGIVCDNYKLESFKAGLIKAGFSDFDVFPFTKGCSTIKVKFDDSQTKELTQAVKKLELDFQRKN